MRGRRQVNEFDSDTREREMSLDVHVTLAMKKKSVQFCKKKNKKWIDKVMARRVAAGPHGEAEEEVLLKF